MEHEKNNLTNFKISIEYTGSAYRESVEEYLKPYIDAAIDEVGLHLTQVLRDAIEMVRIYPEHATDGSRCWCNPDVHHVDPDTGAKVYVHKLIQ